MAKVCASGSTPPRGRQATCTSALSPHGNITPRSDEQINLKGIAGKLRCTAWTIFSNKTRHGSLRPIPEQATALPCRSPIPGLILSLPGLFVLFLTLFVSGAHSAELAQRNGLLYDSSPYPTPVLPRLVARGKSSSSAVLLPTQATFTLIPSNAIAAATADSASASQTSLPQPFDTSLGNNFTNPSCPQFFRTFLNDKDFKQCYPFSLLLQTSTSFFAVEKSFFRTTQTLDVSCNVNFQKCSSVMASFANKIRLQDNCAADYTAQNPLVLQAYHGLSSYVVMFQASCQKDSSGDYCFANAITNTTSSADSYPYFLPLGMSLAPGTRPTCSSCLKNTMQVFAAGASNSSQLISKTYPPAAEQINSNCGENWVQVNVRMSNAPLRDTTSKAAYCTMLAIILGLVLSF